MYASAALFAVSAVRCASCSRGASVDLRSSASATAARHAACSLKTSANSVSSESLPEKSIASRSISPRETSAGRRVRWMCLYTSLGLLSLRTSPDAARQARQVYFCAFLAKVAVTPAHRRWYQSPHTSHPSISRPPGCRHKQNWPSSLSGGSPVPSRSAVAALIDCRMSLSAVTESSTAIAWTPALLRGRMRSLRSRSDHADDAAAAAASSTPSSDLSGRPSPAACISRTSAMAGRSSVLSLAAARRSATAVATRVAAAAMRATSLASSAASSSLTAPTVATPALPPLPPFFPFFLLFLSRSASAAASELAAAAAAWSAASLAATAADSAASCSADGFGLGGPKSLRAASTHRRCSSRMVSSSVTRGTIAGSSLPASTSSWITSGVGRFSALAATWSALAGFCLVATRSLRPIAASTFSVHPSMISSRRASSSRSASSMSSVSISFARSRRSSRTSSWGNGSDEPPVVFLFGLESADLPDFFLSLEASAAAGMQSVSRTSRSHSSAARHARTSAAAGSSSPNRSWSSINSVNVCSAPSSFHRSTAFSALSPHSFASATRSVSA